LAPNVASKLDVDHNLSYLVIVYHIYVALFVKYFLIN
jgi:hypothetical protein